MLTTSRHVRKDKNQYVGFTCVLHLPPPGLLVTCSMHARLSWLSISTLGYLNSIPLTTFGSRGAIAHRFIFRKRGRRRPQATQSAEAFPPGRAVGLPRDQMWDVMRLIAIAATKESAATCPMARVPMDALVVLGGLIVEFLRVPSDMHLHPPATKACKICFTPICDMCENVGLDCRCGTNNLQRLRGDPERALPCDYAFADRCFPCGGGACVRCTTGQT